MSSTIHTEIFSQVSDAKQVYKPAITVPFTLVVTLGSHERKSNITSFPVCHVSKEHDVRLLCSHE